jgi:hypothetical protein
MVIASISENLAGKRAPLINRKPDRDSQQRYAEIATIFESINGESR